MRRRVLALVTAVMAASVFALGTVVEAGASVGRAKAPLCAGKTKKKAIKAIETAYAHFLDGAKYPDAATDKAPYIQFLSEPNLDEQFLADFIASSEKNAAAAAETSVAVDGVKCTGKKEAEVDFALVLSGQKTDLVQAPGHAVYEGKKWKVTALTLCDLQALGDPTIIEREPCATIALEG